MTVAPGHDVTPSPGRGAHAAALAAVVALAAVLRLIGLGWGLPDVDVRPDESITNSLALGYLSGDLNPHWFGYPSLFGYLVLGGLLVLYGWWRLTGAVSTLDDFFGRYATDPTPVLLTPRLISAVAGTATVWLVYRLARRALGDREGLAAAFLMAVVFLPVRDAHFGTTDTTMVFLATLSALLAWSVYEGGGLGAYLGSGLALGLAVSTKYTAAPFVAGLAAAHALRPVAAGPSRRHAWLVAAGVAAAIGFVIATPYSVLAPREFLGLFSSSSFAQHTGASAVSGSRAWVADLTFHLPRGLGLPVYLAGLIGLALLAWRDGRAGAVLLAGPLAYLAAVGWSRTSFARYVLPLAPIVVVGASAALVALVDTLTARLGLGQRPRRWAVVAAVAAAAVPSLVDDAWLLRHLTGVDTRTEAAAWMTAHLPDGATIGWMGTDFGRPPLPEPRETWTRLEAGAPPHGVGGAAYVRARAERARTRPGSTFRVVRLPNQPDRWDGPLPPYLLHEHYGIDLGGVRKLDRAAARWIERGPYELVRAWPVTRAGRSVPRADPHDAVYLPYGRLGQVTRSGPALYLYRLQGPGTPSGGGRP